MSRAAAKPRRTLHAANLEREGGVHFSGGHEGWARFYFMRAVHADKQLASKVGMYYRSMALHRDELAQRNPAPSPRDLRADTREQYRYHWLAKHYFKRALPVQQHDAGLLTLLSQEYAALAALAPTNRQQLHFQERAQYYNTAAQGRAVGERQLRNLEAARQALNGA